MLTKRAYASLIAVGFIFCCAMASGATPKKKYVAPPVKKPILETEYASGAVARSYPMKTGHAYVLAPIPYLRVVQNTAYGLLIHIDGGTFASQPDTFILKSSKKLVDDSLLPVPTCAIYTGVMQYESLSGVRTVHQFVETSCKNYSSPNTPSPRVATSTKSASTQESFALKAKKAYDSPAFPAKQKRVIQLIVSDLQQCQKSGTCQLASAWYMVNDASTRTDVSSLPAESREQFKWIAQGNWKPAEYMFAEDYLAFKSGGDSSKVLASLWGKLGELPDIPNLTIADVYAALYTLPKLDSTRWKEAFKYHGDSVLVDMQTVQKTILPVVRNLGDGPPVQYTYWLSVANMFGQNTEPKQTSVSCPSRANIPPESQDELLYKWFCLSSDAQSATGYPVNTVQPDGQAFMQAQQALQKQTQQQQSQQLLYQGMGLFSQFSSLFH